MNEDLTGRIINGAYQVEQLLADGGMSVVYLATQLSLSRLVVLKILRPGFIDEDFINLFLREARINSQLNHPNVVSVVDFGKTEDNIVYLAMEYLDGHTLDEIVEEKSGLPLPQVLWVLEQLCSGIHAAHRLNVVHRDLKPNNVMISRLTGDTTVAKVLDFGISKPLSEEDLKHTRLGMIMGTPGFLAPEQIQGCLDIDPRADIYAIGALIFFMAAGHKPFSGASREIILSKQVSDDIPKLDPMNIQDPNCLKLQGIISKAMNRDREKRYPDVMSLWNEVIALAHATSHDSNDMLPGNESGAVSRYQFVFTGDRLPDTTVEAAKQRLTKEFSLTSAIAEKLFCGRRVIVKKDLSSDEVKELDLQFVACGCQGKIEEVSDATRIVQSRPKQRGDRTEPSLIQPIAISESLKTPTKPATLSSFNAKSLLTSGIRTGLAKPDDSQVAKRSGYSGSKKTLGLAMLGLLMVLSIGAYSITSIRYSIADAWMQTVEGYQYPRGVAKELITLGMSAPFSGSAKEIGRSMHIGVETYLNEINSEGGVHGRKIVLVAENDGYEPSLAIDNATKFLQQESGTFAMLGNVGTPTAKAILPIALDNQMIVFGTFSGASLLRNNPPDRYVFNYRASYAEETQALIHYFVKLQKINPAEIGVFYQNDSYGKDGFSGVIRALQEYGIDYQDIPAASYERNSSVVTEAVRFFSESGRPMKAIIVVGAYTASAGFTIAMRNGGYRGEIANVSFVGARALAEQLQEGDTEQGAGIIVSQVVPHYSSFSSGVLAYRNALKKYFPNEAPDFISEEGYIAAKIFVEGLKRAGRYFTDESLVDSYKSMKEYDAGIGELISFSAEDHQASKRVWGTKLNGKGEFESLDLVNVSL